MHPPHDCILRMARLLDRFPLGEAEDFASPGAVVLGVYELQIAIRQQLNLIGPGRRSIATSA